MQLLGLFIGIDRYESPAINWLTCASKDARALHALFTDNLPGQSKLLTDSLATKAAIAASFNELASANEDDVVVIAFSGHGSPSHQLITFDSARDNLEKTAISLDDLTNWFSLIPAKRLICILDCCFSGGMGAKVLQIDNLARDLDSVDNVLQQLSGDGRLIITASSAIQPAWENQKIGHGFLTHYILEALQGAEEVTENGKIKIYRLLEHVTKRVSSAANQIGKEQTPTVRGKIDGDLSWPIFKPGPLFQSVFPERKKVEVSADIYSLEAHGFPSEILRIWGESIPKLNQLQIDAINEYRILEGEHLFVSAPTSSGKTMIGELAALRHSLERKRSFFLFPLKALVNDKQRHFSKLYGGYGIKVIQATGDSTDDIPALMTGQYDICLMTYEKFTALALGNPHILEQAGLIVIDEIQMIADKTRGVNLEFVSTLLKMKRQHGIEPQLIALSAVIGDTNGFEQWFGARLLRREERPVPLEEGILTGNGSFRYIDIDTKTEKRILSYIRKENRKGSSQDWIVPLVRRLVSEGKQVIVFRETRGEARGTAGYLASSLGLPSADETLNALPKEDPSIASEALKKALASGIAFHISDLDKDERNIVEEHFRAPNSKIRVIAATTTLAMGVNTPAEAVIIAGLTHPGNEPYSVAEYKNIAGRAGRLGFADKGISFLLALNPRDEHDYWNRYLLGKPEDLESRFLADNTDSRSLIVRVLVGARRSGAKGLTAEEIVEFLEGSFGSFCKAREINGWKWDRNQIINDLSNLALHKLIELDTKGLYELTELGWLAGQGGIEVESITRLVEILGPLKVNEINDPTLITVTQLTVELDSVLFPLNKRSTQKEPQEWTSALSRQNVSAHVLRMLKRYSTEDFQGTARAKKAAACLLWISDLSMAKIEEILTQFGRKDGAAGPVRSVAARTFDLLHTVIRVAEILHPQLSKQNCGQRLLTRMEVGAPADIIHIAENLGSKLSRGDYLALMSSGISTMEKIDSATDDVLLGCVNNDEEKLTNLRLAVKKYYSHQHINELHVIDLPEYIA